jgi:hypothetical protein
VCNGAPQSWITSGRRVEEDPRVLIRGERAYGRMVHGTTSSCGGKEDAASISLLWWLKICLVVWCYCTVQDLAMGRTIRHRCPMCGLRVWFLLGPLLPLIRRMGKMVLQCIAASLRSPELLFCVFFCAIRTFLLYIIFTPSFPMTEKSFWTSEQRSLTSNLDEDFYFNELTGQYILLTPDQALIPDTRNRKRRRKRRWRPGTLTKRRQQVKNTSLPSFYWWTCDRWITNGPVWDCPINCNIPCFSES